jgi:hypothetical protein
MVSSPVQDHRYSVPTGECMDHTLKQAAADFPPVFPIIVITPYMIIIVSLDVTPCSLIEITCCLHLEGRRAAALKTEAKCSYETLVNIYQTITASHPRRL